MDTAFYRDLKEVKRRFKMFLWLCAEFSKWILEEPSVGKVRDLYYALEGFKWALDQRVQSLRGYCSWKKRLDKGERKKYWWTNKLYWSINLSFLFTLKEYRKYLLKHQNQAFDSPTQRPRTELENYQELVICWQPLQGTPTKPGIAT